MPRTKDRFEGDILFIQPTPHTVMISVLITSAGLNEGREVRIEMPFEEWDRNLQRVAQGRGRSVRQARPEPEAQPEPEPVRRRPGRPRKNPAPVIAAKRVGRPRQVA